MPRTAELPEELQALTRKQACTIPRGFDLPRRVASLVRELRANPPRAVGDLTTANLGDLVRSFEAIRRADVSGLLEERYEPWPASPTSSSSQSLESDRPVAVEASSEGEVPAAAAEQDRGGERGIGQTALAGTFIAIGLLLSCTAAALLVAVGPGFTGTERPVVDDHRLPRHRGERPPTSPATVVPVVNRDSDLAEDIGIPDLFVEDTFVGSPEPPRAPGVAWSEPAGNPFLVTSVPPNARIELDGEFEAYTPHLLELTSGSYRISLGTDERHAERWIKVGPLSRGIIWCVDADLWQLVSTLDWREAHRACSDR